MSLIFIVRTNCSAGKSRLNHMSTRGSPSNEKEISHGRVSWHTYCAHFAMGPLASSIG
jgi:hypothetical protein